MIDRVAALADIVAPSPALRPPASTWVHRPLGIGLALVAIALTAAAAALARVALRRALARRRLRTLARRLRAGDVELKLEPLLPAVWVDLQRAGLVSTPCDGATRALCERLRYARGASPDALRELLERVAR